MCKPRLRETTPAKIAHCRPAHNHFLLKITREPLMNWKKTRISTLAALAACAAAFATQANAATINSNIPVAGTFNAYTWRVGHCQPHQCQRKLPPMVAFHPRQYQGQCESADG